MGTYFRLECWWPMADGLGTDKVTKIVGRQPSDSGAGMGQRDVGWHFPAHEENLARAAYERLRKAGYECACSEYDDHHRKRKDKS